MLFLRPDSLSHKIIHFSYSLTYNFYAFSNSAPLCPVPPQPPTDGSIVNNPIVFETEREYACAVNYEALRMKCPSFLNIYIKTATIGRNPALGKTLCNRTDGNALHLMILKFKDQNRKLNLQLFSICHRHPGSQGPLPK
jgi:hypothetical protein